MTANIGHIIYLIALLVLIGGLYTILTSTNYIKKIIGLCLFQNSILIFYVAIGKVASGAPPINVGSDVLYTSPLPQVLMLTAIVVGFATLSVALALILQIKRNFGTLDSKEINR